MNINNRVRAILLDSAGRLTLIKRVKPNTDPYWVVPGGGVEHTDDNFEAALKREIMEELGGTIEIIKLVKVVEHVNEDNVTVRQYIYLSHLLTYDLDKRTGPEFMDPTRGEYIVEMLPLTEKVIGSLNLLSDDLKEFLIKNGANLYDLPDLRKTARAAS